MKTLIWVLHLVGIIGCVTGFCEAASAQKPGAKSPPVNKWRGYWRWDQRFEEFYWRSGTEPITRTQNPGCWIFDGNRWCWRSGPAMEFIPRSISQPTATNPGPDISPNPRSLPAPSPGPVIAKQVPDSKTPRTIPYKGPFQLNIPIPRLGTIRENTLGRIGARITVQPRNRRFRQRR